MRLFRPFYEEPDDNKVPPEISADQPYGPTLEDAYGRGPIDAPEMLPSGGIDGLDPVDVDPVKRDSPPQAQPDYAAKVAALMKAQQGFDADKSERMRSAAAKDRKEYRQDKLRESLRAAFARETPRNIGEPPSYAATESSVTNSGPLSQELMAAKVLEAMKGKEKPQTDEELRAARVRMLASQAGMYDRANQPKPVTEKPPKVVDEEMRAADIRLKNARADYMGRSPKASGKAGGGNVPAGLKAELGSYEAADDELRKLEEDFKRLNVGGGGGRLASKASEMLGLNNDYTAYLDSARRAMQAVGTILEGGKLAAGDEVKYRRMMPEAGDSPERVQEKISGLRGYLKNLREKKAAAVGLKTDPAPMAADDISPKKPVWNGTAWEIDDG